MPVRGGFVLASEGSAASGGQQTADIPEPRTPAEIDALPKGTIYRTVGARTGERYSVRGDGPRGGGDTLHPTLDEARAEAERAQKREQSRREAEEREEAERKAEEQRKADEDSDDLGGFLSAATHMRRGQVKRTLNKVEVVDGQFMTRRELIEAALDDGSLEVGQFEEPVVKPMSRQQFNRATQAEQDAHEARMREAGTKTVYTVNGIEMPKTAHDYASFLLSRTDSRADGADRADGDENARAIADRDAVHNKVATAYFRVQSRGPVTADEAMEIRRHYSGAEGRRRLDRMVERHGGKSVSAIMDEIVADALPGRGAEGRDEVQAATAGRQGGEFSRDRDMRGLAFAVTNANGDVVTNGTVPAMMDADAELAKAGHYADIADSAGGALHVAPISGQRGAGDQSGEALIFGKTWDEIQRLQQRGTVSQAIRSVMPDGAVEVYRATGGTEQSSPTGARGAAPKAAAPKASANTVFTEDAAAAARARLKAKLGRLNSGIDPEMLQDGITLAGYHIEKGARTFAAYARAMVEDLGDSVKPYLKSWYMGVKYDPRSEGLRGLDDAATVDQASIDEVLGEKAKPKDESQDRLDELTRTLIENIDQITDNRGLRRAVADYDGIRPPEVSEGRLKEAQEAMEAALTVRARQIVKDGGGDKQVFGRLLELYQNQPTLNVRSTTSINRQAYSTPAPAAFVASRLAGINPDSRVYEPTAGNGMLLIGAAPENVVANELTDSRADVLEAQGFEVWRQDATEWQPEGSFDAIIANPPFGKMRDESGKIQSVKVDGYKINAIDHLIAARALEKMKDDGKAVLILGADKNAGEIKGADKWFFNWLYSNYKVADHFELGGDLYNRQGAGWPIRMIVVDGRADTGQIAPKSGTIDRLNTWEQVYERFQDSLVSGGRNTGRARSDGDAVRTRHSNDDGEGGGRADVQAPETDSRVRGGVGEPGGPNQNVTSTTQPVRDGIGKPVTDGDRAVRPGVLRDEPDGRGDQGATEPNNDAGSGKSDSGGLGERARAKPVAKGSGFQSPYQARSAGFNENVLTPNNMAPAIESALADLESRVGDLDAYVMNKLGYDSVEQMHGAFMGLQVDAIAAAIDNMERGKGIIIADQTGVGKGRQAAGIIRYAERSGMVPVFMTVKDNLFTDMYGDLQDIGADSIRPFVMNADTVIKDGDAIVEKTPASRAHRKTLEQIARTGELPDGYSALFLTYSQIRSQGKQALQRDVLNALRNKALFVMDEAHEVAGERDKIGNGGVVARTGAGFAFDVIEGRPVTYLSATYAKRPDNMPVYYRTDLSEAVDEIDHITAAFDQGGVPLQTVVSAMLSKSGQLFRRERSFDGIEIRTEIDTENTERHARIANEMARALLAITKADQAFHSVQVDLLSEEMDASGGSASGAGNRASQSLNHANFTSVLHNFVSQLLTALKAGRAVSIAESLHKQGVKPVFGLENTMESFIKHTIEDEGLSEGDVFDYDFRDVMQRALDRTRRISVDNGTGDKDVKDIALSDLDPVVRAHYDEAQSVIDSMDIADLPLSPIDYVRYALEKKGINVSELTGREWRLDYSGDKPVLRRRDPAERKDKRAVVDAFNKGSLDGLVLNASGATGLSIHASERFADQKPRHMLMMQAPKDINIMMQMLGRINRTGQVARPSYTMMGVDIPAEKRPLAVASKKMKSLNANTSANTESDTSVDAPDMFNKYGDQIVFEYLRENAETARKLDMDGDPQEGIALKFTGRLPMLPVDEQRAIYDFIEPAYNDLIEYLTKIGQNDLEPQTLDLDARVLETQTIYEGKKPDSAFGGHTYLHKVDAKMQGKPPTAEEARDALQSFLAGRRPDSVISEMLSRRASDTAYERAIESRVDALRQAARSATEAAKKEATAKNNDKVVKANNALEAAIDAQEKFQQAREAFVSRLSDFAPGDRVRLQLDEEVADAMVVGIKDHHETGSGNPYAPSKVRVSFLVNSGVRTLNIPLSRLGASGEIFLRKVGPYDDKAVERLFSKDLAGEPREQRYIATGNLIQGAAQLKGQVVSFTDNKGRTNQGILLPKKFGDEHASNMTAKARIPLRNLDAAERMLREHADAVSEAGGYQSSEGDVRIRSDNGSWQLITNRARKFRAAAAVRNDPTVNRLVGDLFGRGSTLEGEIKDSDLREVLEAVNRVAPLSANATLRPQWEQSGGSKIPDNNAGFQDGGGAGFSRTEEAQSGRGRLGAQVQEVRTLAESISSSWANGPEVVVVETLSDPAVPEEIRAENERQLSQGAEGQPEGVYYKGKVYLVAEGLRSVKDVPRVLFHEALGHAGLRGLFGSDLAKILDQIAIARPKEIAAKAKEYGLNPQNSRDRRLAAEEVLAEMAQTRPELGFVKRAVAAIRSWLRDNVPYFAGLKLTDAEIIRDFILPARRFIEQGGKPQRNETPAFQRDGGPGVFAPSGADSERFRTELARWFDRPDNLKPSGPPIAIGQTPQVMQAFGVPNHELQITKSTLLKVTRTDPGQSSKAHGLGYEVVSRLPEQLADPVAIFRSKTQEGAYVVLTELQNKGGEPVMAAIHVEKTSRGRHRVNDIASLHGRPARQYQSWVDQGLLRYYNKNKAGLRLDVPAAIAVGERSQPGSKPKVYTPNDVVKWAEGGDDLAFSRSRAQPAGYAGPRVENWKSNMAKLRGFWESAADTLLRTPGLEKVGEAVRLYYDRTEANRSAVSQYEQAANDALSKVPRGKRKKVLDDFARHRAAVENGRRDEAAAILANADPALQSLIDAWKRIADVTGDMTRAAGVMVEDKNMVDWEAVRKDIGRRAADQIRNANPREWEARYAEHKRYQRPNQGGLDLDTEEAPKLPRKSGWRPMGKVKNFWPRQFNEEVQKALDAPHKHPGKWNELVDALMATGKHKTREKAADYLIKYRNEMGSNLADSDYFAGIEKARTEPLPEVFYDYSWEGGLLYKEEWADRLAQIQAFGQAYGQGPNAKKDLFDQTLDSVRDDYTRNYLLRVRSRVYNERFNDPVIQFSQTLNTLATGLQLGNPATALLNILGGTALTYQAYGIRRATKELLRTVANFRANWREAKLLGVLHNDYLQIMHDSERTGVPLWLRKTTGAMLKYGGYTPAEHFIRTHNMLTGKAFLRDALDAFNRRPASKEAARFAKWIQRNGFDVDRLVSERGSGEYTDRFIRYTVNLTQGSYRIDQTPVFVDTQIGRFLWKYQKFGTQLSRMFWMNHLKPFVESINGGDKTTYTIDGQEYSARLYHFMPLLRFFGVSMAVGVVLMDWREELFGYQNKAPTLSEIDKALQDDDTARAIALSMERAFQGGLAVGMFGFFGNYYQMSMDVADRQRVKSPLDPPALAPIEAVGKLVLDSIDKGGMTLRDVDTFAQSTLSIYRTTKRAAANLGADEIIPWQELSVQAARSDAYFVKKMTRRYASEAGIEAKRRSSGNYAPTENSAFNNRVIDLLLVGESATARVLVRQRVRDRALFPTEKDRRNAMLSLKSAVRSRDPARVSLSPSDAERQAFLRWARVNTTPEEYQRIMRITQQYRRSAQLAGLL